MILYVGLLCIGTLCHDALLSEDAWHIFWSSVS